MSIEEERLPEEVSQLLGLSSFLSAERKRQIAIQLQTDVPQFVKYQAASLLDQSRDVVLTEEELSEPQWFSPATASPVVFNFDSMQAAEDKKKELEALGFNFVLDHESDGCVKLIIQDSCRVSFAFYKKMCEYKHGDSAGCRFCCLSGRNKYLKKITPEAQLESLQRALARLKDLKKVAVFEILPDGSFLNSTEVSVETQKGIMARLAQEKSIQRVAIETRPEYCSAQSIKNNLNSLRPDQQLEVYFGLETTDEFIGQAIHKKGYSFTEFKLAISRLVEGLTPEELKRIKISVYHIFKPAYLTEQESMQSALQMAKDVKDFSIEVGVDMEVKYEPSVVSKGTLQGYLYEQRDGKKRRYQPLNYFTVAELIALLHRQNLSDFVKFGQRDDIDEYTTVAMISQLENESMFSQFDYLVYNAVQRFNSSKDIRGFLIDMKLVIENSPEFKAWEKEFYGQEDKSELSNLLSISLEGKEIDSAEEDRINFQKKVWQAADEFEYSQVLSKYLARNGHKKIKGTQTEEDIINVIQGICQRHKIKFYEVKNFSFVDIGIGSDPRLDLDGMSQNLLGCSQQAAFQLEIVIFNEQEIPQSLWVKIPLKHQELPNKPDFIYQ